MCGHLECAAVSAHVRQTSRAEHTSPLKMRVTLCQHKNHVGGQRVRKLADFDYSSRDGRTMIASLQKTYTPSTVATAPRKAEPALTFDHVTVRFDDYTAVADASITIGDGEFVSIVGPTGCGKSTLL